jgi:hypothetical protein
MVTGAAAWVATIAEPDGGVPFWSPGQSVESRGIVTLLALTKLGAHGRIGLPRGG